MTKYNSRKVEYDGMTFDSKKELERWKLLKAMEDQGEIDQLQRQVKFELIPKQQGERACHYVADFVYIHDGQMIVEDVKGSEYRRYNHEPRFYHWQSNKRPGKKEITKRLFGLHVYRSGDPKIQQA